MENLLEWLGAIGGFVAGIGALIAVVAALGISQRDRKEALAREARALQVQVAQRRVDEAMIVLEAWERLWAMQPKPWDPNAEDRFAWRQTPEYRAAQAHLTSVIRASGEAYTYMRSGFRHFGYDDAYGVEFLARDHDLGAAGATEVFDPESEDTDRRIIRMEILEVVAEARRQMAGGEQAKKPPAVGSSRKELKA